MPNLLEQKAKIRANQIREKLGFFKEPVTNIFELIESLNILLTKKPLNNSSISAYFLHYKNNYLFFINSAHTLGRQHFSAAHEIYHYYFDKELNGTICDTFKFKNQRNESETLADYFAVHFLMPEDGIYKFFNIVGDQVININKIIKAQNYFKVSFKAMLVRLKVLELIDEDQYNEFSNIHLNSTFAKLGYSRELILPTNDIYIPQNYLEILNDNYEQNKITENAYKEYLADVGLSIKDILVKEEVEGIVEESSFDY